MLRPVHSIAFAGIYDLVVPKGTSQDRINGKAAEIEKIANNSRNGNKFFTVVPFYDRVRIVSSIDNPNVICELFEAVGGENLAKQYIQRNVQEYKLNVQV